MRVAIVRHGKAEPDAPSGRDQDRPLAAHGHTQIQWLARTLIRDGHIPDVILASGHLRAATTAKILAESLERPLHREPLLELGHTSGEVLGLLDLLASGKWPGAVSIARPPALSAIMLVGHNPQLERLAGVLLGGPTGEFATGLRTGEAIILDLPQVTPGKASQVATLRLPGD